MAFVRRKGNTFYLVHNVRHGGKVRQLHLARLGKRARITDQVVREVSKKHPFIDLNWRSLREQLNGQLDLVRSRLPGSTKSGVQSAVDQSGFGGFVSAAVPNF